MTDTDAYLLTVAKQEWIKGIDTAFEQILRRYERLIYHIARRYFYNTEDAMDACQEAVIRIYKGLSGVEIPEGGNLKGWICKVTANTCVDMLRKRRVPTEPLTDTEYIREASAEESALARERVRDILNAVDRLPEDHKRMIILRDMNGLSYQELAEAAGVNVGTVKSRLSRARAALIKLMEK
jgi:RNA polymerase sigma-70 factor (ECF subfamily)